MRFKCNWTLQLLVCLAGTVRCQWWCISYPPYNHRSAQMKKTKTKNMNYDVPQILTTESQNEGNTIWHNRGIWRCMTVVQFLPLFASAFAHLATVRPNTGNKTYMYVRTTALSCYCILSLLLFDCNWIDASMQMIINVRIRMNRNIWH